MTTCPFCTIAPEEIIARNAHTFTVRDTLIVPKRHIASIFEAIKDEVSA